ncbi:MAG TPA: DUF302 domain-containing protein [Micromonosporaceae bacterium]|jgi:uncharacterized protein (DUF302 family)
MNGILTCHSDRDVADTVAAIADEIRKRGAAVVAIVDHAAAAEAAALTMPATQVIIFGNPAAGTPLMLDAPDIAIDLPLRILVRDDGSAGSAISWQDPEFVGGRFGLGDGRLGPLSAPASIIAAVLGD